MLSPTMKVALFMEGAFAEGTGKLGLGVLRYGSNPIACIIDTTHAGQDSAELTGILPSVPIVGTLEEAASLGSQALILGIAPPGGLIPDSWWKWLDKAVDLGISLVNGLHDKLAPRYPDLRANQFIWDVRTEPKNIGVGTGAARLLTNKRALMVGTDMSVGKMTAALEIERSAQSQGVSCGFVATGQTGIIISGSGVPLDAIRLDYASGAIESEVLKHSDSKLVVIEGQGSLIHPGSSATLPLMRGSCPTDLILCHRAGMSHLPRIEWIKVPPLLEVCQLFESLASACGTFPSSKVVAIALNTGHMNLLDADIAIKKLEQDCGMPVCDPVRQGGDVLLNAILTS